MLGRTAFLLVAVVTQMNNPSWNVDWEARIFQRILGGH